MPQITQISIFYHIPLVPDQPVFNKLLKNCDGRYCFVSGGKLFQRRQIFTDNSCFHVLLLDILVGRTFNRHFLLAHYGCTDSIWNPLRSCSKFWEFSLTARVVYRMQLFLEGNVPETIIHVLITLITYYRWVTIMLSIGTASECYLKLQLVDTSAFHLLIGWSQFNKVTWFCKSCPGHQ